uniref:Fibrinogen C-terminal domain-containing protein n=1 Tax=Romanomermis culicivorax TaxID=13658 RepID=A0A915ISR0_ROMCU
VTNFPVNASGHCSLFDNATGCLYDCESSAIGKACGQDQVFCDAAFSSTGCGKCVSDVTTCIDRRYQRLCDTSVNDGAPIFQCASTLNCVLFSWINDGVNDCGDFSDEDPCLNGYNCSQKLLSTVSQVTICTCNNLLVTNGTLWQVNDTMFKDHVIGRCQKNPLQFDCGDTNNTCIDMNSVRNCKQDCPNGADENCWAGLVTCPDKCNCVAPSNVSTTTQYATTVVPMNVTIPTCYDLACIYNICAVINASKVCNNVTEQNIMMIHDCADLAVFALLYGARLITGPYLVFNATCPTLNDSCLIPVFCDMDQDADGGYTVIQRRNSGNLSFAKSWDEYKRGFGALDSEFWIGNDYMSILTNRPGSNGSYELLILVKNSSGVASRFKYNKFGIGKESTYYHLMLGSLVSGAPVHNET